MILHCDACLLQDCDKPIYIKSKIGLTNIKNEPYLILINIKCKEKLKVNNIIKFFSSGFKFQYPNKTLLIKNANQFNLNLLQNQLKKILKGESFNELLSFDQIEQKKFHQTKLHHIGNNIDTKVFKDLSLKQITFTNTKILPRQIWKSNQLTELNLIDCNLIEIPEKLVDLGTTLKLINFENNKIIRIHPKFFIKLPHLTCINLSKNLINVIPLEICFCTQITSLNFGYNLLTNLPYTIIKLSHLKELNIEYNKFKSFPFQFWKLVSLHLKLAYLNLNGLNLDENLNYKIKFPTLLQLTSSIVFERRQLLKIAYNYIPPIIMDDLQKMCRLCATCKKCFCQSHYTFKFNHNFDKFTLASLVLSNTSNKILKSKVEFCFRCKINV